MESYLKENEFKQKQGLHLASKSNCWPAKSRASLTVAP